MIDLLRNRRSVRRFQDRPVEPDKLAILQEALLRSPSSRNFRPWEFVIVTDPALLGRLAEAKPHGSAFLAGAPLGIAVCADEDACDVWIEDGSIASILTQMTAQSLGLGSCWIQIRLRRHDEQTDAETYVRRTLDLPENLRVLSLIAIGYPAETPAPIPADQLDTSKLHRNGW